MDEFLTVAEVAEMLKLNQQTVRNWIDQRVLPAIRVGRRVRIRRADLDRMLAEGSTSVGSSPASPGPSAEDFWGGAPTGIPEPVLGRPDASSPTSSSTRSPAESEAVTTANS